MNNEGFWLNHGATTLINMKMVEFFHSFNILQQLSQFPHADWLIAILYKSTDNKNDIRSNTCFLNAK